MTKRNLTLFSITLAIMILGGWYYLTSKTGFFQTTQKSSLIDQISPKVIIITMFQLGDPLDPDSQGEATIWVQEHQLTRLIDIPGAYSPLYCNQEAELCLVITGVGTTNATITMMALGLSDRLDLKNTYYLMAGIGGIKPDIASIESVAWIENIVDITIVSEYDAREMPDDFDYYKFPYACSELDCEDPPRLGTEFYQVNQDLVDWGYQLTKDLELEESKDAINRRSKYLQPTANHSPTVEKCSMAGGNSFWHGKMLSDWVSWWMDLWTEGTSPYCITSVEEPGIAAAIHQLGKIGRVDPQRLMVIRVGSNFDQQHPNQTVEESLSLALQDVDHVVGMHNLHLVGWKALNQIIQDWSNWEKGIPMN
jgi:purine nucleoside permease